jgi:glycosyltransferase involved in cell wall biosynthesis
MSEPKHKIGVDIIQPIVPEYRVALFDGLAQESALDVFIQASERMGNDFSFPLKATAFDYHRRMIRIGRLPLYWQTELQLEKAQKGGDVLVVCGDLHYISTFPLIVRAKKKGIGVLWWGHHVSANPRKLFVAIRLAIAKRFADCMLCYTDQGRDFLLERGFSPQRVFATGNTIDLDKVELASSGWTEATLEAFKKEHGLSGCPVLLFSSVLRRKTRLDVLLNALAELRKRKQSIKCVIIGDGEMRDEYKSLAQTLNVDDRIVWVGELRDQQELAPWFLSASAFVYPGPIGLSLIHAFAYGLPVIVNDNARNHGPEYAIFSNGENGWAFNENGSGDLARVIEQALEMPERLRRMGGHGKQVVFQNYSMKRMVERFKEAIMACSRLRSQQGVNT